MLNKAVLVLIYKRPELTYQVISSMRKIRPRKLYVVADGPKNESERKLCDETRGLFDEIDWDCKVYKNYSDKNMGLRRRVSSGISWFFDNEESGIILEDDCVADPSFFRFCSELLDKYNNDERVMVISGDNYQMGRIRTKYSYYFSRYNHCWGWATWRRAWDHYDDKMKLWPEIKKGKWLNDIFDEKINVLYWKEIFDLVYKERIDSWAYVWTYSCWLQSGLTILPNVNLVKNIGIGKNSTHTKFKDTEAGIGSSSLKFPLKHPPFVIRDAKADRITDRNRFLKPRVIVGMLYRKLK